MTSKLLKLTFALFALAPALAFAVPPFRTIAFSARIADNGRPVTGSHTFDFKFWNCDGTATTCTTPLWSETQTLTVNNGVATAGLGDVTVFPTGLWDGTDRWLSVTMDGTDFGPFMPVRSVPYAMVAAVAGAAVVAGAVPWSGVTGKPTTTCIEQLPTTANPQTVAAGIGQVAGPTIVCPTGYQAVATNVWYSSYNLTIWDLRAFGNVCWALQNNTSATSSGSFYAACRCCPNW